MTDTGHAQGTDAWMADRLGKVTASRIADTLMKPTAAGYQNYRAQIVCERLTGKPTETFVSDAMKFGTDTEPQARAMYELETCNAVTEAGFVPHPTIAMTGASPDGLIGDAGLVEIKCPQPAQHIRNLTGANIARNYGLQMQWQMVCCERDWCDFVSFSPAFPDSLQLHIQRVNLDAVLAAEIDAAVIAFLIEVDAVTAQLKKDYMK